MKNKTLQWLSYALIFGLYSPCLSANEITSDDSFEFLDIPITEVQQLAGQQQKLYFILFTAEWVMPCQWMEENTFNNQALSQYIESVYLPVKVDVSQQEGKILQQQYEVTALPSILAFSSRGLYLGKQEGALEAEELLEWLKQYDIAANKAAVILSSNDEDLLSSPRAVVKVSRPALIPTQEVSMHTHTSYSYAPSKPQQNDQEIEAQYRDPDYFTVQTGVFSSYENALSEIKSIEQRIQAQAHFSQEKKGNVTLYRILVGRLGNRTQALELQQQLKKLGISGFVKKIDN